MEVNLFVKKIKQIRDKQRLKKSFGKILLVIILILALSMVGLSSYSLMVVNSNTKFEQDIGLKKAEIKQFQDVETKQIYLMNKLEPIENLLSLQERHQNVAEAIFELIPNETSLKGFDINESGKIKLSGNVPNWLKFFELIGRIKKSTAGKLRIVESGVNRINFSDKGQISFDIDIVLSGNKNE